MQRSLRELKEGVHGRATHDEVMLGYNQRLGLLSAHDSASRASRGGREKE